MLLMILMLLKADVAYNREHTYQHQGHSAFPIT